jgi:hypothetical protein
MVVSMGVLFGGYVIGELLGLAIAALGVALVAIYRHRRAVRAGGATAAERTASFLEWCKRRVVGTVDWLGSAVDWLRVRSGRLAAWLRSLPTSLSGLASRLGAWLRTLPTRLASGLGALPPRRVAAMGAAVAVVAVATDAFDTVGFLGSTALVGIAALGWWLRQRETSGSSEHESPTSQAGADEASADPSVPTLRELWRRLAAWVLPGTWRTRTPAEVSRAAVEKGLPRGPVETLTEAFRDVEYGGRPEEGRQTAAKSAFDALDEAHDREDESE